MCLNWFEVSFMTDAQFGHKSLKMWEYEGLRGHTWTVKALRSNEVPNIFGMLNVMCMAQV